MADRKLSQTSLVEQVDQNDTVVLITANGANARATVAQIAQGMSESEVTKESIGLGNVDNTSDADKPVSTATQEALNGKADSQHNHAISGVVGLQTALDSKAPTSALNGLATTQQLTDGLATKADVSALDGLATSEELTAGLATKADASAIAGLATTDALTQGLATKADTTALASYATTQALTDGLALKADAAALEGLATTQALTDGLATKADASALDNYATTQALTDGLATKADTSALTTLATTESVDETFSRSVVFPSLLSYLDGQYPVFHDGAWTLGDSDHAKFIWVDSGKQPLFRNGSYEFPYASIQDAIDALASAPVGGVINVVAGSANYSGFTINNLLNLQIQGYGLNDAQQVKIVGEIVYTGANCTRIKMKDLEIQSSGTDKVNLNINGTQGRHYFENVTLTPFSGAQTAPICLVDGAFSNWVDCFNCNFSGLVSLAGTPAPGALFATRGGNDDSTKIVQTSAINIVVNNHTRMGYIEHVAGTLSVSNVQHWTGSGGIAIKSTADATAGNGVAILYSDFLKDNGTWLKIDKEGAAPYRLAFVNRNPQIDVLTGTRIALGGSSDDIMSDYEANNYTANDTDSIKTHLAAIDTSMLNKDALKNIAASAADFAAFQTAIAGL